MLNLNPNPCPICGGKINLFSHAGGGPDARAKCQACKAVFPFQADLKTYGNKVYASSAKKAARLWNENRDIHGATIYTVPEGCVSKSFKTKSLEDAYQWILDNFNVEGPAARIIHNILDYADNFSGEDQYEFLTNLLDGTIGLDEEELRALCWN